MAPQASIDDPHALIDVLARAAQLLLQQPLRCGCVVHLPAEGRLLVTGDLHDNPVHLSAITKLARLERGPVYHVILHELIHSERLVNGVDLSYRMLARVAMLVCDFPGQVHPLLANHELSQLTGAGVSKGAGNSVELFNDGLAYVFDDRAADVAAAIAEFIRAMPLALRSESGLMCSHSLPSPRAMESFDATIFDRELAHTDCTSPDGAAYQMVWGRGHTQDFINTLAEAWNVSLFCVGHEHAETGIEMKGSHHLILNSDHERGVALPVDLAQIPKAEEAILFAVPLRSVPVDEVA